MAKYKVTMTTQIEFVVECDDKYQLDNYLSLNDVRTVMNDIENKGGLVYNTITDYITTNSTENADFSIKTE